ncbi:MAG: hypothetical protein OEM63_08535, partial [Gammaproteobacteria bacterium]|nr:hypothetical protein [Gammaproteobacteria bacterium]
MTFDFDYPAILTAYGSGVPSVRYWPLVAAQTRPESLDWATAFGESGHAALPRKHFLEITLGFAKNGRPPKWCF